LAFFLDFCVSTPFYFLIPFNFPVRLPGPSGNFLFFSSFGALFSPLFKRNRRPQSVLFPPESFPVILLNLSFSLGGGFYYPPKENNEIRKVGKGKGGGGGEFLSPFKYTSKTTFSPITFSLEVSFGFQQWVSPT
jgi:hypothetical protein